jgi:hypothetical protein
MTSWIHAPEIPDFSWDDNVYDYEIWIHFIAWDRFALYVDFPCTRSLLTEHVCADSLWPNAPFQVIIHRGRFEYAYVVYLSDPVLQNLALYRHSDRGSFDGRPPVRCVCYICSVFAACMNNNTGILALRTYALYHQKRHFKWILMFLFIVCIPVLITLCNNWVGSLWM